MSEKTVDNAPMIVLAKIDVDNDPRIVLAKLDIEAVKRARRWLRGAAMLLADASNGDELIDRIADEAAVLANMAAIALHEYGENPPPHEPHQPSA